MLTTVSVVPPAGAYWPQLDIPVLAPNDDGVFVQKITGLEPVTANIVTNTYNELDGEFFVNSNVGKRNIVLDLVMEHRSLSISDVRRKLYGYFMPQMVIALQLSFTDRDPVIIEGHVESCEGDRFTNDPELNVSVICEKPNFKAIEPVVVRGQSTYDDPPPLTDVLNTGDRAVGFELLIANDGSVDFNGSIHLERLIEGATPGTYFSTQILYLDNTDGSISLPASVIHTVYINTKQSEKTAEIQNPDDGSQIANLIGNMSDDSGWPVLWSAMNKVRVITTDTTGWAGNHLDWTLTFTPEFGGV